MLNQVILWDAEDRQWLTFSQPIEIITAYQIDDVLPALQRIEQATSQKRFYAAGFLTYEAAPAFDTALCTRADTSGLPLLCFGLYDEPERSRRLPDRPQQTYSFGDWQASVSKMDYGSAIDQIKEHIARGDTYQVNYTLRLRAPFNGDAWSLFRTLERAQQTHFAAYVDLEPTPFARPRPNSFSSLIPSICVHVR